MEVYKFLKECGAFFVLSVNGDYPAGRPFGAVMEVGDDLYLSTNDMNQAHKQIKENEHIQKDKMLEVCPALQQRFGAIGMEHLYCLRSKLKM